MTCRCHRLLCLSLLWWLQLNYAMHLSASDLLIDHALIDPQPVATIINPFPAYTLLNSVAFHPHENLCCVACTHANQVALYRIDDKGLPAMVQSLSNPQANLCHPAHAAFSPDGKKISVANWSNQTIAIYQADDHGLFGPMPAAIIPCPERLTPHRPHASAFSPCGKFLAIAYGASSCYGRALALFRVAADGIGCQLFHLLQGNEELPGIPKGVAFSHDGTCLLVTFADENSLLIFGISKTDGKILKTPLQVIQGDETGISRPEDVKLSPNGDYCALSNSDKHTVSFYPFDKASNRLTQSMPCYVLENPEAELCFPHGLAFSPDGLFFLITEFGPIHTMDDGGIFWEHDTPAEQAKVHIYKTHFPT